MFLPPLLLLVQTIKGALRMDQSNQSSMLEAEGDNGATKVAYASPTYQHAGTATPGAVVIGSMPSATQQTAALSPYMAQLSGQQQLVEQALQYHPHQQQLLQAFWANQMSEIEQTTDFKNQSLPLARIKKIMKADEDVHMISAEAPVVFAKACELFILELTLRAWIHTEENKRWTLQKNDIAAAITQTDIFDFLVDVVPRDELNDGVAIFRGALPAVGATADSVPYRVTNPGMIMWHQPQLPPQQEPSQNQDVPEADEEERDEF